MAGREAYQNPGILAAVGSGDLRRYHRCRDPVAVVRAMYPLH